MLREHLMNMRIQKKIKKYLDDAMMTSIAGISAAMKNTG
jgi:phosphoenolpyruvate carboxylase